MKPKFNIGDEVMLIAGKTRGVIKAVAISCGWDTARDILNYTVLWDGHEETMLVPEWELRSYIPPPPKPKFKVGDEVYNGAFDTGLARGIIREVSTANPPTYKVTWQYAKGPWESSVQFREDGLEFWANRPQKEEKMKYQFNLTPAHIYGNDWEERLNESVLPSWEIVGFRPPVVGQQYIAPGPHMYVYTYNGNAIDSTPLPPRFIVRPLEPVTDADRLTYIISLLKGWNAWPDTEEGIKERLDNQIREERKRKSK